MAQTRRITDYFPRVIPPPLHGATLPIRKLNPYLLLCTRISAKWTRNVNVEKWNHTSIRRKYRWIYLYIRCGGIFSNPVQVKGSSGYLLLWKREDMRQPSLSWDIHLPQWELSVCNPPQPGLLQSRRGNVDLLKEKQMKKPIRPACTQLPITSLAEGKRSIHYFTSRKGET